MSTIVPADGEWLVIDNRNISEQGAVISALTQQTQSTGTLSLQSFTVPQELLRRKTMVLNILPAEVHIMVILCKAI